MKTTEKNNPKNLKIGIPLLPNPYNIIAHSRLIEKKSYKEIANETNKTENHCRIIVYRAKKKLFLLDKMLKRFKGSDEKLEKLLEKWKKMIISEKYFSSEYEKELYYRNNKY